MDQAVVYIAQSSGFNRRGIAREDFTRSGVVECFGSGELEVVHANDAAVVSRLAVAQVPGINVQVVRLDQATLVAQCIGGECYCFVGYDLT